MRGCVNSLYCYGELITPGHVLDHYVFFFDSGLEEGFAGTGHEGGGYYGVPPCVDDCYAEFGAWNSPVSWDNCQNIGDGVGVTIVGLGFAWAFERGHYVCNGKKPRLWQRRKH